MKMLTKIINYLDNSCNAWSIELAKPFFESVLIRMRLVLNMISNVALQSSRLGSFSFFKQSEDLTEDEEVVDKEIRDEEFSETMMYWTLFLAYFGIKNRNAFILTLFLFCCIDDATYSWNHVLNERKAESFKSLHLVKIGIDLCFMCQCLFWIVKYTYEKRKTPSTWAISEQSGIQFGSHR